ncbi:MAG: hypothetical protein KAR03_01765, partial [Candidatus Thorarchaeota archaeon]|nr:hypothetical protein [Candidatus Thorarchaeota archaeon]
MEDLPIFPDGAQELIPIPILTTIRNAFNDILLEDPQGDMLFRDEPYSTLVYVEDPSNKGRSFGRSGFGFMMGAVGTAVDYIRTVDARIAMSENVKTFYYLIKLKLQGFHSDVVVLFQGGFVEQSIVAISTMSIGTICDYSIPRGSAIIISDDRPTHMSLPNCGDTTTPNLINPLASVMQTELSYESSNLSTLMNKLQQTGGFASQKTGFAAAGSTIFSIIPHQGKTVVSVLLTPLNKEPPSLGQSFPMRLLGQDKPLQLEVSIPSEERMKTSLEIIKRYQQLPDNLRTNETPTSTLSGYGVSALLSLDIAQSIYATERSSLSLYEILESGLYYKKITNSLKAEFNDMNVDFKRQFPRFLIFK